MSIVRVIRGKFSVGREKFRDIVNVEFPLVDGNVKRNEKGDYIQVNGIPVRGFPKRIFKVFIDDPAGVEILPDGENMDLALQGQLTAPVVDDPIIRPPTQNIILPEDVVASLNGPDDHAIKERIGDRFYKLSQLVWAAADGDITGLVVSGPPGIGKSFGVEAALEGADSVVDVARVLTGENVEGGDGETSNPVMQMPRENKTRYSIVRGHVSPLGLYKTLFENSDDGNVLVFDDCDSILFDEISLNLLKTALDNGNRRVLSWVSSGGRLDDTPDRFTFKGSVVFITNLDFERPKSRASALSDHLGAIMSRVYYLDLSISSIRDKYLRIEQVCRDYGVLQAFGLDQEEIHEVMDFFKTNITKFREISIRTVQKIGTMRKIHSEDWRTLAAVTTFRTAAL